MNTSAVEGIVATDGHSSCRSNNILPIDRSGKVMCSGKVPHAGKKMVWWEGLA